MDILDKARACGLRESDIELLAQIPGERIDRYSEAIKKIERNKGFFLAELAKQEIPALDEFAKAHEKFMAENPIPSAKDGEEAYQAWQEKENALRQHFRGDDIHQSFLDVYGSDIDDTNSAHNFVFNYFLLEGGTEDQFNALHQAVLARVFSRPLPPHQALPGPALD